jgi:uncharacterized membrane protein
MRRSPYKTVRNNIIVGLLLVTPLAVTAIVFNGLFKFVTNRFMIFFPKALRDSNVDLLLRVGALLVVLILLFFVGLFVRNLLGRRMYQRAEKLVTRIPLFNRIYLLTRQVIESLFTQRNTLFQEVVLLEYPRAGVYAMGFVTAVVPAEVRAETKELDASSDLLSVFIPTTPNPTSGWLCIVPRSQVMHLSMSPTDGMKLVISGGAVFPGEAKAEAEHSLLEKLQEWAGRADQEHPPTGSAPPT